MNTTQQITAPSPMEKGWIWAGDHWVLDVNVIEELMEPGLYRLRMFVEGADYNDFSTGQHIQSIGVDKGGRIWASTDGRFVDSKRHQLLWVA